jgi:starch synthase
MKVLFTIHNMAYQGVFRKDEMRLIGLGPDLLKSDSLEFYGKISFMKAGLIYSDALSTVSRKYAEEIMTPEYGCGLDGLLRSRKDTVYGVLNGVDYKIWNPERDDKIKANYGADTLEKKTECKKDLLDYTGLSVPVEAPLIGAVTRLVEQKGMDLAAKIMDRIVDAGAGVVILGMGGEKHNRFFSGLSEKFPGKVYVCNEFNNELAHKIEAGCDIFLMPSRYEPCGLNQMYSLKYGTIPVVRATGGLDDAIVDFDEDRKKGNGFKFDEADEKALLEAVKRAVTRYKDKALWQDLMKTAMSYDYSWDHSAKEYVGLYTRIKETR